MCATMADPRPGQILTRGLLRALHQQGWAAISEVTLATGRRVDAMAIDGKGEITVVEVKSSVADFQSDGKWHEYRDFCDRFFFAVPTDFPQDLLPADSGLFVVDPYGGALIRPAPVHKLSAARRKALLITFAALASRRLHALESAS
ncbi:MAG: MmcB family DNA repair protein [Alphaproteobacteria bacterium]|nr:MmcB family DNA repair protein [Alphaproteobacteria bacterium]MCB9931266.1 MmcB family DNA repair protein [Alphaproteobacteria bacterium]